MELNLVMVIKSVLEQTCIGWADLTPPVGYPGKDIVRLCDFLVVFSRQLMIKTWEIKQLFKTTRANALFCFVGKRLTYIFAEKFMKGVAGGKKVTKNRKVSLFQHIERTTGRAKEHFWNKFALTEGKKLENNELLRKVWLQKQTYVGCL